MDPTADRAGTLKHLLDLTVACDDAGRLIEAAGATLHHPLGLVDAGGEALGCTPEHGQGQRALALAMSAARTRVVPPPGWDIKLIAQHGTPLGVLAIGEEGPTDDATRGVLALLPTMLAGQLRRAALVRLQRAAFIHRLVSDPAIAVHRARREAAQLGLRLADAYWVGTLDARSGALRPEIAETVEREAGALVEGSLTTISSGQVVLLHPGAPAGSTAPGPSEWFRLVARRVRVLAPSSRAQLIAGERAVDLPALGAYVRELLDLRRFGPRAHGDRLVVRGREYALDRLHETIDPEVAARFVDEQLGGLLHGDARHGRDLLCVLEAALDFPRHDEAARRCFMHRNTFRHRLRLATDTLARSLDDPDDRLALHVALKLQRLAERAAEGPARVVSPAASARRGEIGPNRKPAARRGNRRARAGRV